MFETIERVYHLSFNLCLGLIILIIVNLTLDSIEDIISKSFELQKLIKGVMKGIVIIICFLATYFVGYLNKDLVVINIIDDHNLSLMEAVALMTITAYFFYAKQVIEKLFSMIIDTERNKEKNI